MITILDHDGVTYDVISATRVETCVLASGEVTEADMRAIKDRSRTVALLALNDARIGSPAPPVSDVKMTEINIMVRTGSDLVTITWDAVEATEAKP